MVVEKERAKGYTARVILVLTIVLVVGLVYCAILVLVWPSESRPAPRPVAVAVQVDTVQVDTVWLGVACSLNYAKEGHKLADFVPPPPTARTIIGTALSRYRIQWSGRGGMVAAISELQSDSVLEFLKNYRPELPVVIRNDTTYVVRRMWFVPHGKKTMMIECELEVKKETK
jgi:hypothetical protein